jgi:hypothetical protein
VALLLGLGYALFLAWVEGWRLGVVLAILLLVAGVGWLAHRLMDWARRRDRARDDRPPL